jgi:hypothetical protein
MSELREHLAKVAPANGLMTVPITGQLLYDVVRELDALEACRAEKEMLLATIKNCVIDPLIDGWTREYLREALKAQGVEAPQVLPLRRMRV